MAIKLADLTTVAMANAAVDLLDGGVGDGVVKIYTGAQNSDPDAAPAGTLLVTIPFSDPAFGAAAVSGSDGVATANALDTGVNAVASGTAAHFVAEDSAGNTVFTGTVTATGGGGDIELDNTSINSGQEVQITSLTFTVLRDAA